jgi:hypothetical protein
MMAERRGSSPRVVGEHGGGGSARSRAFAAREPDSLTGTLELEAPGRGPRWTSGREGWVFRAESPDELSGFHPPLVRSALGAEETLHYLLYSPLFEGTDGPFRVGGTAGSHSVGLTSGRLVVSHDPHAEGRPRSVTTIDLDEVSCLELGSALLFGWLVVRGGGPRGPSRHTVTFNARGMDPFRALVRAYRRLGPERGAGSEAASAGEDVWEGVPAWLRSEIEPLLEPGERPLAVVRSPERWTSQRRRWRTRPACASATGLLIATPRGLLRAASELRRRPGDLAFGVNVTVVRADRLSQAAIEARDGLGALRLAAGEGPGSHELEVLFDAGDAPGAERILRLVRAWGGRA